MPLPLLNAVEVERKASSRFYEEGLEKQGQQTDFTDTLRKTRLKTNNKDKACNAKQISASTFLLPSLIKLSCSLLPWKCTSKQNKPHCPCENRVSPIKG